MASRVLFLEALSCLRLGEILQVYRRAWAVPQAFPRTYEPGRNRSDKQRTLNSELLNSNLDPPPTLN